MNSTITANTQNQAGDAAVGASGATAEIAYSTIVGNIHDETATCGLPVGEKSVDQRPGGARIGAAHARTQAAFQGGANVSAFGLTTVTLFGNVISGGVGASNCAFTNATVDPQGYNFSDDTSCELTAATDKVATPNDPQLNALGAWGGPTNTMLPFTPLHGGATSPLIDAIPAAACQTGIAAGITTDQRGVTRPQMVGCDIGAVEVTGAEFQVAAEEVVLAPKFTG